MTTLIKGEFEKKVLAVAAICVVSGITGFMDRYFVSSPVNNDYWILIGPLVIDLAFVFWWLHLDNRSFSYRRSSLFNVGVVAFTVVFVAVYLVRSRAPEARLKSLLLYGAALVAISAAYLAGTKLAQ